MGAKKYFIAIVIPEPLFTEIESLKHELLTSHGLKGALRSPAHITLHRPFEWKEEKEGLLIEKLRNFKFDSDFKIELQDFAWFEPRVIYVNVQSNEQLFELHSRLTSYAKQELKLFNEAEDLRGFHPHVTIASRDLKKPIFYELQESFKSRKLEGIFGYQGFSLLKLENKWEFLHLFKNEP